MAFTPGTGAVISVSVEGAQSAQRRIESIGDTMQSLATNAKASLKELAAFAGFGLSLGAVAEQVLSAQREFDKLNAALVTATGSTADAAAAFKSLQAFAASTPYSVADATEAFIKMKNLGLDPSEKALRSYGNTAAAMGKGLDQMIEAVADAATGEFERLKEFGITSKQSGDKVALTFKGITTTIGKNADEIQAYLKKLGDTDFAGAMALRADTLDGAISNLGDAWDAFMLKLSQSGVGDVAKNGVVMLADNLQLLAGVIGTVAAAKLGSTFAAWATDTYKQVAASVALRAATVAEMEAAVAGSAAKVAQLQATQAMIVVSREEAMAKLASSNASIAAAETAIAAAEAAGVQSFALRTLRLATAELTVAETARAAALAELSVLGTQQASVSAKVTAARLAEKAAQDALNTSTATGTLATGVASRALGLLGGPFGAIITVLGLAATAWSVWGNAAKEGSKQATESYEDAHKRIVKGLDEQIAKNQKLVQLQNLGLTKPQIDRNQPVLDQLAAASKRLNDINNQTGDYAPGKGKDSADATLDRVQVLNHIVVLTEKMKKSDESAAEAATGSTEAMIALRQRLAGVNQQYLDDLEKLQVAREKGEISQKEYAASLLTLAQETFANSTMGKLYAQSLDAQAAAIQRVAEAQGLRNERDQAHIQFLKSTGQADDEATIRAAAAAQIKGLNDQISSQQNLMAVESRRQVSAEQLAQKQADSDGKVANLRIQIGNVKAKREEDLFALEQQRYRTAVNNSADLIEKEQAELVSLKQQTQAQIDQNDQIGLTTKQIAALTAMRLEEAAARKDGDAIVAEGLDLTGERAERIREEARAIRERATAVVDGATKQEVYDKNLQDLNAMVDIMSALDSAAQSAAQGMANAFGSVGSAIGGMTTALSGYERTQAAIAAQLASATKDAHGDQTKIQRANMMAAEASAQAQIKSYGDMAGAAKGFFNENSAGYKVLNDVEKAYRAAEMAMALESMAKKIFFKETEVVANTTLNATKVAGEAASTAASVGLAGTEASAWGVTAVVKAVASMPFPLNLAAGAATLAAVVGLGVKLVGSLGAGGVSLSQQRQQEQGAGSVLGDKDAKSESIKK
jgi:hypothetical protein